MSIILQKSAVGDCLYYIPATSFVSKKEAIQGIINRISSGEITEVFNKRQSIEEPILFIDFNHNDVMRVERVFLSDTGEHIRTTGFREKTEKYLFHILNEYDIFDLYFRIIF